MRLIDADALMKDIRENSESYFADDFAHEWVDRQPTIDAVPVVHSWWEISEHNNSLIPCVGYRCHNCGSKYARIDTEKEEYNYCPHCGAHMDGHREEENDG